MDTPKGLANICTSLVKAILDASQEAKPSPKIDQTIADLDMLTSDARASAMAWLSPKVGGMVRPTIRFYSRTGVVQEVVMADLVRMGPGSMAGVAAALAVVISKANVDAYFVVGEVWAAAETVDPQVAALRVRDRSDRQEFVLIAAANTQRHTQRFYPINRGVDGHVRSLGEAKQVRAQHFSPIFDNLFALVEA